jgi:dolichyl-phosphate beta-glucosyltransferase
MEARRPSVGQRLGVAEGGTMMARVCWIVPCHNEAQRLNAAAFVKLVDSDPDITLLFVNDGSQDATEQRLRELADLRPRRIEVLSMKHNHGKGEAVRQGLLHALSAGSDIVGYFDADLATPTSEMRRLTEVMVERDVDVVIGSRVAMLGRDIERSNVRHYLGRVFATGASLVLGMRIYDTQCGAKLFRRTPAFLAAIAEPFHSRWIFDVELVGRLVDRGDGVGLEASRIVEEPLESWHHVGGSKLRARDFAGAVVDLPRIALALRRVRRAAR